MGGRGERVDEGYGVCMELWLRIVVIGCTIKIKHFEGAREMCNTVISEEQNEFKPMKLFKYEEPPCKKPDRSRFRSH